MIQNNIRRIAVTGVHKADIVMYCAYILQKLEYDVLVCDGTKKREMERCIRKPGKPMDIVRYKDIDFAFSEFVSLDERYDYILYVRDFGDIPQQADKHIFISDGQWTSIEDLVSEISRCTWSEDFCQADCMIVYRDLYSSYGLEYVEERLKRKLQGMFINSVHHDCMDEACYQRMQFRPFSHLTDVSADMELTIKRILQFCSGMEEKTIKRGIRQAKRGRAY